jgi:hypothetical protein
MSTFPRRFANTSRITRRISTAKPSTTPLPRMPAQAPVVRDDKFVGIIARADMVRAIIRAARKIKDAVNRNEIADARLLELE